MQIRGQWIGWVSEYSPWNTVHMIVLLGGHVTTCQEREWLTPMYWDSCWFLVLGVRPIYWGSDALAEGRGGGGRCESTPPNVLCPSLVASFSPAYTEFWGEWCFVSGWYKLEELGREDEGRGGVGGRSRLSYYTADIHSQWSKTSSNICVYNINIHSTCNCLLK